MSLRRDVIVNDVVIFNFVTNALPVSPPSLSISRLLSDARRYHGRNHLLFISFILRLFILFITSRSASSFTVYRSLPPLMHFDIVRADIPKLRFRPSRRRPQSSQTCIYLQGEMSGSFVVFVWHIRQTLDPTEIRLRVSRCCCPTPGDTCCVSRPFKLQAVPSGAVATGIGMLRSWSELTVEPARERRAHTARGAYAWSTTYLRLFTPHSPRRVGLPVGL